jgi:hypothetical protein
MQTSPCDTNEGEQSLIVSFAVPGDLTDVRGLTIELQVETALDTLPDWWRLDQCRAGAIEIRTRFVDPPLEAGLCADPWLQNTPVTLFQFAPEAWSPRLGRLIILIALPSGTSTSLQRLKHYYACEIVIRNDKTTGPDACAGCSAGACISPLNVRVETGSGTTYAGEYNVASWQGAFVYSHGGGCQ